MAAQQMPRKVQSPPRKWPTFELSFFRLAMPYQFARGMLRRQSRAIIRQICRIGASRRLMASRPGTPNFAATARKGQIPEGAEQAFKEDPDLFGLLQRKQWEDDEGPDPTPEELAEEDKMADEIPVTDDDVKEHEDLKKQSTEELLKFIDMDEIAERTGNGQFYGEVLARYSGTFTDSKGSIPVEVTRGSPLAFY